MAFIDRPCDHQHIGPGERAVAAPATQLACLWGASLGPWYVGESRKPRCDCKCQKLPALRRLGVEIDDLPPFGDPPDLTRLPHEETRKSLLARAFSTDQSRCSVSPTYGRLS